MIIDDNSIKYSIYKESFDNRDKLKDEDAIIHKLSRVLDTYAKENDMFYSPAFGDVEFVEIENECIVCRDSECKIIKFLHNGALTSHGECILYPNKDKTLWNSWIISKLKDNAYNMVKYYMNNPEYLWDIILREPDTITTEYIVKKLKEYNINSKAEHIRYINEKSQPKTWDQLIKSGKVIDINYNEIKQTYHTPQVIALHKILYIIDNGYKRTVTTDEYFNSGNKKYYTIVPTKFFYMVMEANYPTILMFRSRELADEFLKYPENIVLLNEFFN